MVGDEVQEAMGSRVVGRNEGIWSEIWDGVVRS